MSAQLSKSYSSADTHSRIQHMPSTIVWTRVFTAFFLCMGCCTHTIRTVSKKLPAHGQSAWLSASPPDDENYVMRTVHGWPKYTLALRPPLLCALPGY